MLEVARALMFARTVPKFFWGAVVLTIAYLIHKMPTKSLNSKALIDTLKQHLPHINCLGSLPPEVFGCIIFVHIPNKNRSKLDPEATKCIFCKCYHLPTQRKFVSMDISFLENQPYYQKSDLQGEKILQENQS